MTYSARAPDAAYSDPGDGYARAFQSALDPTIDVAPADRVGALPRRRRRTVAVALLLLLAGAGGAWWAVDGSTRWPRAPETMLAEAYAVVAPTLDRLWTALRPPLRRDEGLAAAEAQRSPLGGPVSPPAAEAPAERAAAAPVPAPADAPSAPADASRVAAEAAPVERIVAPPPPVAAVDEPSARQGPAAAPPDPLQRRALAAGLHSDLSRVVLGKLSQEDFRNARTAIETALAETADDEVHYWPKAAKAGRAQYQVHFVAHEATALGCRRYVVTIAKDGWATTALPVERCGVVRREARRTTAGTGTGTGTGASERRAVQPAGAARKAAGAEEAVPN